MEKSITTIKNFRKKESFFREITKNKILYLMCLPAILAVIIFNYVPMVGIIMAFKDSRVARGYFSGKWIGLENFKFFLESQDFFKIVFNTLYMNFLLIFSTLVVSVALALLLNEIRSKRMIKTVQSAMFLPYFLSWVVVGFLVYAFLSTENGFVNQVLAFFGLETKMWYNDTKYWRIILVIVNLIKNAGYYTFIYYAAITGIDETVYEAAEIDGASKIRKMVSITIPLIMPMISIMVLLQIGKMFYADFGLFYYVPRNSGVLYPVTDVIDTYSFRALRVLGNIGMSSAVGFFQSVMGFILVLTSNLIVKKINPDNSLF